MRSDFFHAFIKTGLVVAIVLTCVFLVVLFTNPDRIGDNKERAQRRSCVNSLKQIGLALHQWSLDHDGRFPFSVSTNAGGTLELCDTQKDGFDRNIALHFQVMSNELNTPMILVCPNDQVTLGALGFANLRAFNVTYKMRAASNLSESTPREVLVVCPIDGNELYCDGTVVEGKNEGNRH